MAKAVIKIRKGGQFNKQDLDLFRRYANPFQSHNLSIKIQIVTKEV